MRFTGTINAKTDAKGRVFFPAAFRKLLTEGDTDFVIRRDVYQPCLVIYTMPVWEEEISQLRQHLNRWNPREAMLLRQFMADAEIQTLDSAGRFLLSRRMLDFAHIEKDVVFVGLDDRIEIWDKRTLDESFMDVSDFGTSLQQIMTSRD